MTGSLTGICLMPTLILLACIQSTAQQMWSGPARSGAQFCHLPNQKLPLLLLNDVLLLWKVTNMVTTCGRNLKDKWRNGWGWERDATSYS